MQQIFPRNKCPGVRVPSKPSTYNMKKVLSLMEQLEFRVLGLVDHLQILQLYKESSKNLQACSRRNGAGQAEYFQVDLR